MGFLRWSLIGSLSLEKSVAICFLAVGGIEDFVPERLLAIFAALPFHHQPLEIAFLH
jgi:hypothetical protein